MQKEWHTATKPLKKKIIIKEQNVLCFNKDNFLFNIAQLCF